MTSVAYLGPAGSWSEAAVANDPVARTVDRIPLPTLSAVIDALIAGDVDYAVMPIENSLEGGINVTVDTLVRSEGIAIVGESTVDIHHCLIAAPGTGFGDVTDVFSHPQPIAQCQVFLRTMLPDAQVHAVSSTSQAVQDAVRDGGGHAAIGTAPAAALYGGAILRENIEDDPGNVTRFVWLGPAGADPWPAPGGAQWRTSIAFWGEGDGTPGWLVDCLTEFSSRGLNMSRIESRPRRTMLRHYRFFVDLDASAAEPEVLEALAALAERTEAVRVLGSYPAA